MQIDRTDLVPVLKAYVEESSDLETVWGVSDCSAWCAKWVERATGRLVPLPVWHTREEAHALIEKYGSLDAVWEETLSGVLDLTGAPKYGDVGIIDTGRYGQVGGVFLHGRYFAWKADPVGVAFLVPRNNIVKSWSLNACD